MSYAETSRRLWMLGTTLDYGSQRQCEVIIHASIVCLSSLVLNSFVNVYRHGGDSLHTLPNSACGHRFDDKAVPHTSSCRSPAYGTNLHVSRYTTTCFSRKLAAGSPHIFNDVIQHAFIRQFVLRLNRPKQDRR